MNKNKVLLLYFLAFVCQLLRFAHYIRDKKKSLKWSI